MRTYPNEAAQQESAFDALEHMDIQTLQSLALFKASQDVVHEKQQVELRRLTAKYGPNHARVQKLQARVLHHDNFAKALDVRIEQVNTQAEPLPSDAWRIQGYVSSDNGEPLPGLTITVGMKREKTDIAVVRSGKNQIATTTSATGWYSLTLSAEDLKNAAAYPLYLMVLDNKKQILYTSKDRLAPVPGEIDFHNVVIKIKAETDRDGKNVKKKK